MAEASERNYLDEGLIRASKSTSPLWVIPKDLCTRCGVCHVICPTNVITFDEATFPVIHTDGCIDCKLCLKVCPGIDFNLPHFHQQTFGTNYQPDRMGGEFRKAYVGYSRTPAIRAGGSAGGVVTQLLITLLKQGVIDGAVVVGDDPNDPTNPLPFVARSEEQIRAAAQSKYTVVPNTIPLREVRKTHERFAFVGVACQIHGLKKLQELNKRLARMCVLTIGLACRGTMEPAAIRDLLMVQGVKHQEVQRVKHRGGPFPGKFQAEYKNGTVQDLHFFEYKDGAYNTMLRMYMPQRCHMCTDYSAEFADITCSDIWLRGPDGAYLYPNGSTLVLCRTEKGQQVLDLVEKVESIALEPLEPAIVEKTYSHLKQERKKVPFLRIAERRKQGKRAPVYGVETQLTWSDYLFDRIYRATFLFTRFPRARRVMMHLAFSPLGVALVYLKMKSKQYRHTLKARREACRLRNSMTNTNPEEAPSCSGD